MYFETALVKCLKCNSSFLSMGWEAVDQSTDAVRIGKVTCPTCNTVNYQKVELRIDRWYELDGVEIHIHNHPYE